MRATRARGRPAHAAGPATVARVDSRRCQDWNAQVSADDVERRMTVPMPFHDIHPKALVAVPGLWARFGPAVAWQPCRALATVP